MDNHITTIEGKTDEEAQWVCVCGAGEEDFETLAEAQANALNHEKEN